MKIKEIVKKSGFSKDDCEIISKNLSKEEIKEYFEKNPKLLTNILEKFGEDSKPISDFLRNDKIFLMFKDDPEITIIRFEMLKKILKGHLRAGFYLLEDELILDEFCKNPKLIFNVLKLIMQLAKPGRETWSLMLMRDKKITSIFLDVAKGKISHEEFLEKIKQKKELQ